MNDYIKIKGARANNLKNVDIEIPRNKLVVMTGVSGSGKSSLAFDTIYADGQRRYVESLSSYARQFLGQMDKPDLDYIQGLSPAISIDQKTGSRNPRSTVGTVTELYDYMRLLWARIGKPHCPKCGKEIRQQTIDQIIDQLMLLPEGTKLMILAPVVRARKGEYVKVFEDARRSGYVRVRVDGSMYELSEEIKLDKNKKHTIEVVVDRVVIKDGIMRRLADSVETAASLANGLVIADVVSENRQILFSQNYACPDCGISIEELTPRMFSFNTPYGACPKCDGLGMQLLVDPDLIIPDDSLSINGGAIKATGWGSGADSIAAMYYNALAEKYGFTLDTPISELPDGVKDILLYGSKGEKLDLSYERERKNSSFAGKFSRPFEGICKNLERRYFETQSPAMRAEIEECMSEVTCPECHGQRLRKEALAVTVGGINIARMGDMSVTEAIEFVESLELSEKEHIIADRILKGAVSVYHSLDPFAGCGAEARADSLGDILSVVGEELYHALGGLVGTEKAVFFVVSAAVHRGVEYIAEGETHVRACRQYAALGTEAGVGIAAEHLIGIGKYGLGTVGKYYFRLGALLLDKLSVIADIVHAGEGMERSAEVPAELRNTQHVLIRVYSAVVQRVDIHKMVAHLV